jgi:hypothetical protein
MSVEKIGTCKSCGEMKALARYQKESGGRFYFRKHCIQCWSEERRPYQEKYRKDNAEELLAYHREKHVGKRDLRNTAAKRCYVALKDKVLAGYGAFCACCGESERAFLTFDHKNGNGAEHRRKVGGGYTFYLWLVDNDYPDSIQVLCFNCNSGKHNNGGVCPHELQRLNYAKPAERHHPSNWIV